MIVSYLDYPYYSGLSKRISGLAKVLGTNGIKVKILAPVVRSDALHRNDISHYSAVEYIDLRRFRSNNPYGFASKFLHWLFFTFVASARVIRDFRKYQCIIQYQSIYSALPALITKLFLGARVIGDDIVLTHRTLDTVVLRLTDAIITSSVRTCIFASRLFPNKVLLYVPNGIEVQPLKNLVTTKRKRVVFVGSMTFDQNVKAIEKVIQIAEKLYARKFRLEILIVGGPLSRVSHLMRHRLVKAKIIRFLGFLSDAQLREIYASSQIALLPFFEDAPLLGGQRIKALEYFERKMLVISGSEGVRGISGLRDQVHYVSANSVDEIVGAIERHTLCPSEYASIPTEGRKYVIKRYSWERVTKDYLRMIKKLVRY